MAKKCNKATMLDRLESLKKYSFKDFSVFQTSSPLHPFAGLQIQLTVNALLMTVGVLIACLQQALDIGKNPSTNAGHK